MEAEEPPKQELRYLKAAEAAEGEDAAASGDLDGDTADRGTTLTEVVQQR